MGASDIRQDLIEHWNYLKLINLLIVEGDARKRVNDVMEPVADFIDNATSKEIRSSGKELLLKLKQLVDYSSKRIIRRQPIKDIVKEFIKLSKNADIWRFGIPYGWISKFFEPSGLGLYIDLPPHARVGIGVHAGNAGVEEAFLLEDTFILLARAEDMYERMHSFGEQRLNAQSHSIDKELYSRLSALNGEVCRYSRLCVLNSAAFVEAFVNSIGWTEAELRTDIDSGTREELRGTKANRYISLEKKLEIYPKLIRLDGKSPIILSDEKQKKEPFISFLNETKELRDSSMHNSPGKAQIWLPPQKWLEFAQRSVKNSLGVAKEFWKACYPDREFPTYLEQLNETTLHNNASRRVELLVR